jgi:hypothetical protein
MDWRAGVAVPKQCRLALVGNADRSYVFGGGTYFLKSVPSHRDLRRKDVLGIVLDPSRLNEDLLELALNNRTNFAFFIEQERA